MHFPWPKDPPCRHSFAKGSEPDAAKIRSQMFWIESHYRSCSLAKASMVHNWDYSQTPGHRELALRWSCTKKQTGLHLQLRPVRSYLLCEAAKGCQLVVCLRHGNCLRVPYKKTQTTAQALLVEHDRLLPWLPTHTSVHQSVVQHLDIVLPDPILHPCGRFRYSAAQSMVFKLSQL